MSNTDYQAQSGSVDITINELNFSNMQSFGGTRQVANFSHRNKST